MLGWLYCSLERWSRSDSSRLDNRFEFIPRWYIRRLSRAKLVRTLRYVYRNSPFQRSIWRKAGLGLCDLRSPEVLQRIPFTTSDSLAESPQSYCCVPEDQLIHIVSSSGTKNRRKKIYLTADDFDHQTRMIGTNLRRFPGVSCVAAMFLVHDPTWSNGAVVRHAIAQAGMLGFLSGEHLSASQQIDLIKCYGINCIVSTPSYISRLTVEARQDLRSLGIRYIQLGGQSWSETLRTRLQQAWGAKLIDTYGCAEAIFGMASECVCQDGLHLAESDFWIEIIDPATGKVLPDGQEGELVFTTLSRRGMPLVRYRTGDLSHLIRPVSRCPCGLPVRKMARVRGRIDDVLIIGAGCNLYPDEIDNALLSISGLTDYQLTLERDGFRDVLHLSVESDSPPDDLRTVLSNALLSVPSIGVSHDVTRVLTFGRLESVPLGSLSAGRPKTVRIIDRRVS
ncbi:MAG: AMP-binding protein [Actinobacteria bacterium]|nr:AMP-binding protein [Actinomycetota bacterium]